MKTKFFLGLLFCFLCNIFPVQADLDFATSDVKTIEEKILLCSDIKIGLYSGTFDPPTKAHNLIIRSAIENLGLDKLYIFVNKNGEKNYKCSSQERVEMLQLMLTDINDKIVIVAQEADDKCSDYVMIKKILHGKIIHVVGEDSYTRRLLVLPENRVSFDAIAIIPRHIEQGKEVTLKQLEHNAFYLPLKTYESIDFVSSTQTRKKIAVRDFNNIDLTSEVLSYIIEHSFYCFKGNRQEQSERYLEKYYAYMGKKYAPLAPPEFDPLSSEDSWEEGFYKLFMKHQESLPVKI